MPSNATQTLLRFAYFFAVLSLMFASQAQVVSMKAGDRFSYQFNELPFFAESSSGEAVAQGFIGLRLAGDLFDGLDEIRFDAFSDQVDGSLIGTRTYTASAVANNKIALAMDGIWKDLKGAFRVTLTRGSIAITNVSVTVVLVNAFPPYHGMYFGKDVPLTEIFPPALKSRLIGTLMELSWPEFYGKFALEASSSIDPNSEWLKINYTPVASEGNFKFTNDISGLTRFYRLKSN